MKNQKTVHNYRMRFVPTLFCFQHPIALINRDQRGPCKEQGSSGAVGGYEPKGAMYKNNHGE
jgi:hypothetical protein